MTTTEIEDRVARGIEKLDLAFPQWHDEIDLEDLDMHFADRCVLGQVYGHYRKGKDALGLDTTTQSHTHGFTNDSRMGSLGNLNAAWSALDGAWKGAIQRRQRRDF